MRKSGFNLRAVRWFLVVLAVAAVAGAALAAQPGAKPAGPERWQKAIAAFEEADKTSPPPQGR